MLLKVQGVHYYLNNEGLRLYVERPPRIGVSKL